ncbi:uncharacterized protein SAPINGB_P004786 [Magnusiomyces paraingens]|uniref:Peptidase M48 domain-containing protein n=1 Tax=Magnusiomyces paraingens TaxID=2606893 RepID=A0A5E8BZM9_9ASCO|nr:uncharacterized protein SAPINGB_P004786 [Saprochaete ingens]VVT56075.1 unnamed protein product [Saprochaete ingens]
MFRFSKTFLKYRPYSTYRTFNNNHGQISNYKSFWNRHWKSISVVSLGLTVFVSSHLERTPISNRLRLMIVPKSLEEAIGEQGYREVLQQYRGNILPDNHEITIRVKSVMNRLIKASGMDEQMDWRIHVVHDPNAPPNAFVLPSGKVFVFTSILPIAGGNDGLATILSHELSHVLLRHTAESLGKEPFFIIANMILLYAFSIRLDTLTKLLLELPSSRNHEKEADYAGLMILARACFSVNEAVSFWERMLQYETTKQSGEVPEFLSTHPATQHRITNMKEWIPQAEEEQRSVDCDEYRRFKSFKNFFEM